jgi:hypothetical protein
VMEMKSFEVGECGGGRRFGWPCPGEGRDERSNEGQGGAEAQGQEDDRRSDASESKEGRKRSWLGVSKASRGVCSMYFYAYLHL